VKDEKHVFTKHPYAMNVACQPIYIKLPEISSTYLTKINSLAIAVSNFATTLDDTSRKSIILYLGFIWKYIDYRILSRLSIYNKTTSVSVSRYGKWIVFYVSRLRDVVFFGNNKRRDEPPFVIDILNRNNSVEFVTNVCMNYEYIYRHAIFTVTRE